METLLLRDGRDRTFAQTATAADQLRDLLAPGGGLVDCQGAEREDLQRFIHSSAALISLLGVSIQDAACELGRR